MFSYYVSIWKLIPVWCHKLKILFIERSAWPHIHWEYSVLMECASSVVAANFNTVNRFCLGMCRGEGMSRLVYMWISGWQMLLAAHEVWKGMSGMRGDRGKGSIDQWISEWTGVTDRLLVRCIHLWFWWKCTCIIVFSLHGGEPAVIILGISLILIHTSGYTAVITTQPSQELRLPLSRRTCVVT